MGEMRRGEGERKKESNVRMDGGRRAGWKAKLSEERTVWNAPVAMLSDGRGTRAPPPQITSREIYIERQTDRQTDRKTTPCVLAKRRLQQREIKFI